MKRWRPTLSRPPPASNNAILGHYRLYASQSCRATASLWRLAITSVLCQRHLIPSLCNYLPVDFIVQTLHHYIYIGRKRARPKGPRVAIFCPFADPHPQSKPLTAAHASQACGPRTRHTLGVHRKGECRKAAKPASKKATSAGHRPSSGGDFSLGRHSSICNQDV